MLLEEKEAKTEMDNIIKQQIKIEDEVRKGEERERVKEREKRRTHKKPEGTAATLIRH